MDGGEFMIQCDTCKVWQHGICMGYESEDQLHDDDYHCELCRPDMHTELLKYVQLPFFSKFRNLTISQETQEANAPRRKSVTVSFTISSQ